MANDELMRIDEVAQMIGYTSGSVYQLVCQRRIPFIKLSKKALRFDRAEIEAWIEGKKAENPAPDVAGVG